MNWQPDDIPREVQEAYEAEAERRGERQKAEKPERYHISGKHGRTIGVIGDLIEAIHAEHPFERLHFLEFEEVTQEEYENTVLDWRYEGTGWEQ